MSEDDAYGQEQRLEPVQDAHEAINDHGHEPAAHRLRALRTTVIGAGARSSRGGPGELGGPSDKADRMGLVSTGRRDTGERDCKVGIAEGN